MRILIVNPLHMQWEAGFRKALRDHDCIWNAKPVYDSRVDAEIFMWCDENTLAYLNQGHPRPKRRIVFVRRYELYSGIVQQIPWDQVDHVVMVNDVLCQIFFKATGVRSKLIYNAVDPAEWTFRERGPGKNIAWVGFVNLKKNLPLAMQIMAGLPRDYVLHIAGDVQDAQILDYVCNLGNALGVQMAFHGAIPHDHMNVWLENKHFLLNTSVSEGCPNSVIEAMAKGIRPIVHNWPGARQQFGDLKDLVFDTANEAINIIEPDCDSFRYEVSDYSSKSYRKLVETKFGPSNYDKFMELLNA